MFRIAILLLAMTFSFKAISQPLPCPVVNNSFLVATNDTVICNGGCATLSAQGTTTLTGTSSYAITSTTYNPNPFNTGTVVTTPFDDRYSDIIPMPFEFCYFGKKYTQCLMGGNGQVSFNTGQNGTVNLATQFCPYNVAPLPFTSAAVQNCIMGAWYDMHPGLGGVMTYQVLGTAPCRKMVFSWNALPLFSCNNLQGTQQIVLYESTNAIEVFIANRQICPSWYNGNAVVGVANEVAPGVLNTDAFVAPGRNAQTWVNPPEEAWKILPNSPPITTYTWYDSLTMAVIGVGQSITVCPTVSTGYLVKYVATSNCDSVVLWEHVRVNMGVADSIENFIALDPTMCGAKDGSIILSNMVPGDTFIVNYQHNGIPQPPFTAIVSGSGTVTIPNLDSGTYNNMYITSLEGCESNRVGPAVLVNPAFSVAFDTVVTFGCETDQVQFLDQSVGVTQYTWDFGDGTTGSVPSPLHIYQDQGTYIVTLNGSNGFCTDLYTLTVPLVHPLDAEFSISEDSICNGETIFFTENSVVSFDSNAYEWNFGDGATDNAQNTSHQYTTDGIYTASLTVTDYIGCVSIETKQIVVASLRVEIGPQDTSVCLVDSMLLYSQSFYPPYFSDGITYSWSPDANIGSPDAEETYYYNEVPGDYTYVLTATGYPMECVAKDTLTIHIQPRPVLVNVTPNTVIRYGEDIQLNAEGVLYYIWTPPATLDNPNIGTPIGSPREPVIYSVYGMNEHGGCRDTAQVEIGIDYTMSEFVPSVFSPNGDGKNDLFRVVNLNYQKLVEFRVFNRWGKEVYNHADGSKGWDGTYNNTPQDPGVYTYIIRVNVPDGSARVYKGNVTLVR